MKKKDSGFAEKLLPVLLSTGMVFGLVLFSGQLMEVLRTREAVNQIARAYLLEMETKGYLTSRDAVQLEYSLEKECGLAEIDFSGSTCTQTEYGGEIRLVIHGILRTKLQVNIPFFYEKSRDWNVPVEVKLFSTAKH